MLAAWGLGRLALYLNDNVTNPGWRGVEWRVVDRVRVPSSALRSQPPRAARAGRELIPTLDPDLAHRNLLPTLLCKQVLTPWVSNAERADEDPSFLLAKDGVPHGRRVARTLDAMPGLDWLVELVHELRLRELTPRGNPTILRVDEENTHSDRG